jgi:hypothetical protein
MMPEIKVLITLLKISQFDDDSSSTSCQNEILLQERIHILLWAQSILTNGRVVHLMRALALETLP